MSCISAGRRMGALDTERARGRVDGGFGKDTTRRAGIATAELDAADADYRHDEPGAVYHLRPCAPRFQRGEPPQFHP